MPGHTDHDRLRCPGFLTLVGVRATIGASIWDGRAIIGAIARANCTQTGWSGAIVPSSEWNHPSALLRSDLKIGQSAMGDSMNFDHRTM